MLWKNLNELTGFFVCLFVLVLFFCFDGFWLLHAGFLELSRVLSPNSTVGLTPFWSLSGLQDIPVASREESGVFSFPTRRGLTPRVSLICEPEIPVAPGEKHYPHSERCAPHAQPTVHSSSFTSKPISPQSH